jgi:uncharacterized membrane protein
MKGARDPSIDVLRGLAIVTMVAANMAPYSLEAPHPIPFRIFGSFAAPTFVFLAGMMVGGSRRSARVAHAFRRAAMLFAVAAVIDVGCWHIVPFEGFDVLYLLGLALPLASICLAVETRTHAFLAVSIVALTPIVRAWLGYGPLLPESEPWPFWRRWLVDGWFPVFPWLGVALLGTLMTRTGIAREPRVQGLAGAGLAFVGVVTLVVKPPTLVTRAGYSELFYPPTIRVLCIAIGVLLALMAAIPHVRKFAPLEWLEVYGRASLLMYIAHTVLIAFVFKGFGPRRIPGFVALYAVHLAVLWAVAWARVAASRGAAPEQSRPPL